MVNTIKREIEDEIEDEWLGDEVTALDYLDQEPAKPEDGAEPEAAERSRPRQPPRLTQAAEGHASGRRRLTEASR